MDIKKFIAELKRRNVFKVAVAYAVAAWLIIQVISIIAPQLKFPDWVPSFITILVLCGFPIVLIVAWAFELTPEGIKKSMEVVPVESIVQRTGKKINKVIIGILSLAIVFLLIERFFIVPNSQAKKDEMENLEPSIAVLPFEDLSPLSDQAYFSDGLSEEILNVLAKVEELKVAGRTSSFRFKGQNNDLKIIGAELGVNHILEGSVRKSGSQIRITAQLIKVDDGFHMWSNTYDREYTAENLFKIQDEISQQVLNELKIRLLTEDNSNEIKILTKNTKAYEAYLEANQLLKNRNPEDIAEAIGLFKEAINLDPDFANAYARIGIAYGLLNEYGNLNKEVALDSIRSYADDALLLDNNLAMAYAGLGRYYALKIEWDKSDDAYKKAYELEPTNTEILMWYTNSLNVPENNELRMELRKKAYEIEPLSALIITNLAFEYEHSEDYDKALEFYDKSIELHPDYTRAVTRKISMLRTEPNGRLDEAFIQAYETYKTNPDKLDFINLLRLSAEDFDLMYLQEKLYEQLSSLYPENSATDQAKMKILNDKRMFEAVFDHWREKWKDSWSKEDLEEFEFGANLYIYVENGDLESAYKLFEEQRPLLFSDTLTTHPYEFWETSDAWWLFNKLGKNDQAQILSKLPCDYGSFPLEYEGDISKESVRTLYQHRTCAIFKNDGALFADIINELYFNRKMKTTDIDNFENEPYYEELRKHPEVIDVFNRLNADKNSMKSKVIAFLKEEGEWPEDNE